MTFYVEYMGRSYFSHPTMPDVFFGVKKEEKVPSCYKSKPEDPDLRFETPEEATAYLERTRIFFNDHPKPG